MKVRLPIMIQDPLTSRYKGMRLQESFYVTEEPFFLDGPVTMRLAVVDFDPESGARIPGARFVPPADGRTVGYYALANPYDIYAPDFIQVNAFSTVLKTLYMFEEADTLGRPVTWAFGAPQLLIVPRAGEWVNAFYERDSHSLQFFYFDAGGQRIYTALSRDIAAHEAGHAILDGIAPDLYNACTPQSLALHEAVADLTALLMAFSSHSLRRVVLEQTGGSIRDSTAFSAVAEEFGRALDPTGRIGYLRSLLDPITMDQVPRSEPHALSVVLSAGLYQVMVRLHEWLKQRYVQETGKSEHSVSGRALGIGTKWFKSLIFRALDYLPPGEVTFADYGRAILAADQALFPDNTLLREWIRQEFIRRRIVSSPDQLAVETDFEHPALQDADLQVLAESDWAAYFFANEHRDLFGAPADVPLRVRPRLDVTKRYYFREGSRDVRELIFKVSWDHYEPSGLGRPFPVQRQITMGATLVINWETRRVRARLVSQHGRQEQSDRDALLDRLACAGLLLPGAYAVGFDGKPLRAAVRAEIMSDELMRVRRTANLLHLIPEG
ncbi:MAG: hypothetical protein ACP5TV_10590 [Anaerolineae bacterium]